MAGPANAMCNERLQPPCLTCTGHLPHHFKDNIKRYTKAQLIGAVRFGEKSALDWSPMRVSHVAYGQLGKPIGVPTAGLGQLLEPIQSYCIAHGLPPLTVLVVQQESGLPGPGFTAKHASQFA